MSTRPPVRASWAAPLLAAALSIGSVSVGLALDDELGWIQVADVPGLASLDGAPTLTVGDTGSVVLSGFRGGGKPSALAWLSTDGETWQPVELPGAKGSAAFSAAAGPSGFVVVGGGQNGGRIWHSPTGEAWTDVGVGAAQSGVVVDVTAIPEGFVAVGYVNQGKGKKARSVPTAWTSADGMAWEAAPMADVPGAGLDVTAGTDGPIVATLFQPARTGPKRGRTFDIDPPSLEFATSTDGASWQRTGDLFLDDLGSVPTWELFDAGGRFFFRADTLPQAVGGTPEGWNASTDGMTWQPVPALLGVGGALTPLGDGALVLGDGHVLVSDDGATWRATFDEALVGSRLRSAASLPDGRVLAVGAALEEAGKGSILYVGTPPLDGPAPSTECLDPAIHEQVMASSPGSATDIAALSTPDRAGIASALAALELSDRPAEVRDLLVGALRSGSAIPEQMLELNVGGTELPICE